MNKDFKKELSGFEAVWRRVEQGRDKLPEGVKLMPRREKAKTAAVRFNPPRRA